VDGVVTDDNDVFLFGGCHVYRHLFDNQRYVEEYRMDDVARELGMSREQLVALALLLGSDYTEGVAGVGVVNAVEIVQVGGWRCGVCVEIVQVGAGGGVCRDCAGGGWRCGVRRAGCSACLEWALQQHAHTHEPQHLMSYVPQRQRSPVPDTCALPDTCA
jgi:5'-3' exonuclease